MEPVVFTRRQAPFKADSEGASRICQAIASKALIASNKPENWGKDNHSDFLFIVLRFYLERSTYEKLSVAAHSFYFSPVIVLRNPSFGIPFPLSVVLSGVAT